jgi:prepilin-type N-terminal cleavage/methylation domain-containing protein
MKMRNNNKGFTLIELIMVTIILGILAAVAVPRYMGTVNRAEAAAEDAVLSALEANAEAYAMEKFMDTGRKSYPTNPFDGSSVDGYKTTAELAARSGNTTLDSGEWTYTASSSTAGLITHKRNDDSVWSWTYSSANTASGQADDRGSFGARSTSSVSNADG